MTSQITDCAFANETPCGGRTLSKQLQWTSYKNRQTFKSTRLWEKDIHDTLYNKHLRKVTGVQSWLAALSFNANFTAKKFSL